MNRDLTLEKLRENYKFGVLDKSMLDNNPLAQFNLWMQEAINSKILEPNAMCLSTVDINLQPHSRIVLLKGLDHGFVFYTNYNSLKAKQLAVNNKAALNFLWLDLERQVRIIGEIEKVDEKTAELYFNSRPLDSQLGAIASPQSEVISDRNILTSKLSSLKKIYNANNLPKKPLDWGGFRLLPKSIEFWQGRKSRLHDRLRFDKQADSTWKIVRLAP